MSEPVFTNRLAHETSPYLRQHAHNPVDWYPWGTEALERAAPSGPAHLPQHRLLGVPLVPRHGARELRERGDRQDPERPLRQHQGRSRGTARPRPDLHDRRAAADRPGRLADVGVPDAGPAALLRRHLLPARRPLRPARLQARSAHRSPRRGRHAAAEIDRGRRTT